MLVFEVKDMTCGHCVSAITKAVQAADPGAQVQIDLAARRVQIQPASGDGAKLAGVIADAGYAPTVVQSGPKAADSSQSRPESGCCCG